MIKFNRSDFVLVSQKIGNPNLEGAISFGNYHFKSTEPYHFSESERSRCLLIGQVYSSAEPEWSRREICNELALASNKTEFIRKSHHLTGRFVAVFSTDEETYMMGDAMGQFEVYFDAECSVIASSLELIGAFIDLGPHIGEAKRTYEKIKLTTRIQIGKTTEYANVFHLMPNHLIEVNNQKQTRFYPRLEDFETKLNLNSGVHILVRELRGFAKSISKTANLAMPVTGGNDSRILLGAFKDENFESIIFNHPASDRAKKDIASGRLIAGIQDRELEVINYEGTFDDDGSAFLKNLTTSLRKETELYVTMGFYKHLKGKVVLLGHGGEIGRSFFKNIKNLTAQKMAYLMGYPNNKFVESEMQNWLDDLDPNLRASENIVDLFYWEQRMGNWGARILTEISYATDVFSPMNARSVLCTMLRIPKKNRQFAGNDVVKKLVETLDKRLMSTPINPTLKYLVIRTMIQLRVYSVYQNLRLNYLIKKS